MASGSSSYQLCPFTTYYSSSTTPIPWIFHLWTLLMMASSWSAAWVFTLAIMEVKYGYSKLSCLDLKALLFSWRLRWCKLLCQYIQWLQSKIFIYSEMMSIWKKFGIPHFSVLKWYSISFRSSPSTLPPSTVLVRSGAHMLEGYKPDMAFKWYTGYSCINIPWSLHR